MESVNKPYLVYFLPFDDDRFMQRSKKPQDHVCCVMAADSKEAMQKTEVIMQNHGAKFLKFMGIAVGKEEWVDENAPLRDDNPKPVGIEAILRARNIVLNKKPE
jgi:hypothetical protein